MSSDISRFFIHKKQDYCRNGQFYKQAAEESTPLLLKEGCYCKVLHTVKLYLYAVSIFISCENISRRKKSDNIVSCLLNGQPGISWWKRHRKKRLLCVIIIPNLKFLFFMWLTVLRLLSVSCNPRTWLLQKRPWNSCWEIIITYSKSSVCFFYNVVLSCQSLKTNETKTNALHLFIIMVLQIFCW